MAEPHAGPSQDYFSTSQRYHINSCDVVHEVVCVCLSAIDLNSDTTTDFRTKSDYSLYTYRMIVRLRKAAFLLYQSHPFTLVVSRLEVSSVQCV